jgi:hypothetical protein
MNDQGLFAVVGILVLLPMVAKLSAEVFTRIVGKIVGRNTKSGNRNVQHT